jgi:hypothetical protein
MGNIQFVFLAMAGIVLLSSCKKEEYPFSCETDEECSEDAYCYEQVCVSGKCQESTGCLGGCRICIQGQCQLEPTDEELCGNRNCGKVTEIDSCGNSRTVNCGGECFGAQTCGGSGESNMCGCPPPPHAPVETPTWPSISAEVPISASAYDVKTDTKEVVDKQTCLTWKQYPLGNKYYTWEEAKDACTALGNGWRLPTEVELESIVDHYKDDRHHWTPPTINTIVFPLLSDKHDNYFWTASGSASSIGFICFYNGSKIVSSESNGDFVRCVR